jgi:hypothetical protein
MTDTTAVAMDTTVVVETPNIRRRSTTGNEDFSTLQLLKQGLFRNISGRRSFTQFLLLMIAFC